MASCFDSIYGTFPLFQKYMPIALDIVMADPYPCQIFQIFMVGNVAEQLKN